jgi:proteasome lid subunit RPN8/RPN11
MTFADYDNLSPPNFLRHGLFNESLGTTKALAMKAAIEKIFYTEKSKIEVNAIENDILDIFLGKKHEILCQHDWLIDATASASIRDVLVSENLPKSLSILRCEIADNGRLGFLSIEGNKRNPRLDDIQFYLYDIAIEKPEISNWLQSTKIQRETNPETNFEEIEIGISCNSETMRLGDDSVSFHASLFSLGFHKKSSETTNNNRGFLQISYNDVIRKSICNTQSYEVAPVLVIFDQNHKKWQIRISTDIQKQLTVLLHKSGRNETGGLLIGQIDPKKKIVYITRILPAPPDSKCWPIAFERGVLDVPEEVQKIRQQTGGMIDYVGEWHTHPGGGKKLSHIDIEAAKKIQKVLDPISRPTLVMIVTKDGLFPYVFSQEV